MWKLSALSWITSDWLRNRSLQNEDIDFSSHLLATFEWLKAAQDRSGGICEGYNLTNGWSCTSPSTTAMCIPTFLEAAQLVGNVEARERVRKMIDFIAINQQPDGSFGQVTLVDKTGVARQIKETATVLRELLVTYQQTGSDKLLNMCAQAADWLITTQAALPNYVPPATLAQIAYSAALFGYISNQKKYQDVANKNVDILLQSIDEKNCWIHNIESNLSESTNQRVSITTIALTYRAIYETGCLLGREECLRLAHGASENLMRRFELKRTLPAYVNARWVGSASFSDIAGNVQLALFWLHIYKKNEDIRFLNSALKVLTSVGNVQDLSASRTALKGIPESYPIWRGNNAFKLSTVAAKFFVDALLLSEKYIAEIDGNSRRAPGRSGIISGPLVKTATINKVGEDTARSMKIVMMTGYKSKNFSRLIAQFIDQGVNIDAVVIFLPDHYNIFHRLIEVLERKSKVWRKLNARKRHSALDDAWYPGWSKLKTSDPINKEGSLPKEVVVERGIPYCEVRGTNSPEALRVLKGLQPDLGIITGMSIIREPLLSIPRMGILNAHPGLLPYYRGLDAVGWEVLNDDPIGCSVHLIDRGVDTGKILAVEIVEEPGDPLNLRKSVKELQVNLLVWAAVYLSQRGELPETKEQFKFEGLQYYRMHPKLRECAEKKYHARALVSP
jgi:folate-dependent phosphoribosylglycinamide formyltransferase PurN